MKIEGAVILVTGGAGGIGEALVRAFAAERASAIVVGDRDEAGADAVAQKYNLPGATQVVSARCDVASRSEIDALVASVEERFGRLDLVTSNAGILIDGGLELASEDWDRSWAVNVMAHVNVARAALPGMVKRGSGYFLNVASAAGMLTAPGAAAYATTKHAAVGFAEWLAIAYADRGIGVSVLCPEAVRTKMLADSIERGNPGVRKLAEAGVTLEPEAAASAAVAGVLEGRFLLTTHPDTLKNTQRKWSDMDRWLRGMSRFLRAAHEI